MDLGRPGYEQKATLPCQFLLYVGFGKLAGRWLIAPNIGLLLK